MGITHEGSSDFVGDLLAGSERAQGTSRLLFSGRGLAGTSGDLFGALSDCGRHNVGCMRDTLYHFGESNFFLGQRKNNSRIICALLHAAASIVHSRLMQAYARFACPRPQIRLSPSKSTSESAVKRVLAVTKQPYTREQSSVR